MKCPECGSIALYSSEKTRNRTIAECIEGLCGLRFIHLNGEIIVIERVPWIRWNEPKKESPKEVKVKYITINLMDESVRAYDTLLSATNESKKINQSDPDRPSFRLYMILLDSNKVICHGDLIRKFGHDYLFWSKLTTEKE